MKAMKEQSQAASATAASAPPAASAAFEQGADSGAERAGPEPVYAARREAYMRALGPEAVALVHSQPEASRNGGMPYRFHQHSDIHYLTGFAEPDTTLVLRPGADDERVVMFVRPRDAEREMWDGRRAGVEGAIARFGADAAYPVEELEKRLPGLLANCDELHYGLGLDPAFDAVVADTLHRLRRSERRGRRPPRAVIDPRTVLHEMRLRKAPDELAHLRRAAAITAEAHTAAMRLAAPGRHEYELEALLDYTFRRHGGAGPGYNTIVGSGDNATILHYIENHRAIADGDLVLIDAGCEYAGYTADVTRTFPANGRFTDAQRRVYEIVFTTQRAAVAMVTPGVTLEDIHQRCVEMLTEGMVSLGLLAGPATERIEDNAYKKFYPHQTSHWLGLDVHDVGAYTDRGEPRPLEPGMVITIEPGLYVGIDADDVPDELRGIGIRIEDDILVTESGHDNLTAAVPAAVADVEAACNGEGPGRLESA